MRAIDADKLIEKHCADCSADVREGCKTDPICGTIMWLDEAPAITYEDLVPHGRWEKHYINNCGIKKQDGFSASCCGRWNKVETRYCPNCGTKMDGQK